MKKTAFIVAFLTFFMGLLPFAAVAAEKDPTYTITEKANGLPGGVVTIDVGLKNNPGIVTLGFNLNFDETLLEFVKIENSKALKGFVEPEEKTAPVYLRWSDTSWEYFEQNGVNNNDFNGTVITFTFKINDTAVTGQSTDITIEYGEAIGLLHNDEEKCPAPGPTVIFDDSAKATISFLPCGENHNWERDPLKSVDATCEEDGKDVFVCVACRAKKTEVAPAGHDWSQEPEIIQKLSCTQDLISETTCQRCEEKKRETTKCPDLPHLWDEGTVLNEATCIGVGIKTFVCLRTFESSSCEEVKDETIPAFGHNWDDGVVTKPITAHGFGIKTFTCTVCKETKTEPFLKPGILCVIEGQHTEEINPGTTDIDLFAVSCLISALCTAGAVVIKKF